MADPQDDGEIAQAAARMMETAEALVARYRELGMHDDYDIMLDVLARLEIGQIHIHSARALIAYLQMARKP